MTLSKAVLMGNVVRDPEKRFTSNNLAITSFTINISESDDETLVRISSAGKLAEKASEIVSKGAKVIVEGRLQTNVFKTQDGTEKKVVEVMAAAIEPVGAQKVVSEEENFGFDEPSISNDDLIGEEEIPF